MPMADRPNPLLYEVMFHIMAAFYRFGFSLRTEGGHHVPERGPALLIANHQSFLDPVAIGLAARRHIHYLARRTLFHGLFGRFLRAVNCVPVDQEGVASDALRTVLKLLASGEVVLVFPEGERTWTGEMQPLRPGVQLLIKRSQAPVIPVGVAGAYQAYSRAMKWPRLSPLAWPATGTGMAVVVGRPLEPKQLVDLPREQLLEVLFQGIHAVQQQAERLRRKA
jgi:1-acyl-sn-glycerol-3-phosphate acyltransferase